MKTGLTFILLFSLLACSVAKEEQLKEQNTELEKVLKRKNLRIVVTDSGIGGLSVMNDIALKLKDSGSFKSIELIFVNALFEAGSGYNALQTRNEKIEVFSNVLKGIEDKYQPDLIFVACNTLSVLINETQFVKQKNSPPVIGIVEPGVKLIVENLSKDNNSTVVIFGTETTITENTHKAALLSMNIDEKRITTKACPQLQSYIEQNPTGEETGMLISFYMAEALSGIRDPGCPVHISLNCSHFGYSENLWRKAIEESGYKPGKILNPNYEMGNILITAKNKNRFSDPDISFMVVSKVELVNVNSMIKIFSDQSPSLVEALSNYLIIPDLF